MNSNSLDAIFSSEYDELKRMAEAKMLGEPAGISISATALVHEVYLRLKHVPQFDDRLHLMRAAAVAMQRVLIDHARKKRAMKRSTSANRLTLDELSETDQRPTEILTTVQEGLEKLASEDEKSASVAKLKLLSGLSVTETADVLSISRAQAYREWSYAKAWLTDFLSKQVRRSRHP